MAKVNTDGQWKKLEDLIPGLVLASGQTYTLQIKSGVCEIFPSKGEPSEGFLIKEGQFFSYTHDPNKDLYIKGVYPTYNDIDLIIL